MRSFANILTLLFATLFAFAFAQESGDSYDATVYVTSTVYRVNTVTLSGTPTGVVANQTSTISAYIPPATVTPIYSAGNGTLVVPTGSAAAPSASTPADFTGAASMMSASSGVVAVLAIGAAFFAL